MDEEGEGQPVCVVSIVRSGDILQEAVRGIRPGLCVGKILIQRDETKKDKPAVLFYKKLPRVRTQTTLNCGYSFISVS